MTSLLAILVTGALFLPPTVAERRSSPQRLLTLDDLFDPEARVDLEGSPPLDLRWLPDGRHYLQRQPRPDDGAIVLRVEALTGDAVPLVDPAVMERAFAAVAGIDAASARRIARSAAFTFDRTYSAALIEHAGDLYLYRLGSGVAVRITHGPEPELEAAFSPDGRMVSFVRGNDLYVVDLESGAEHRLTTDGGPKLLNGRLDWVYQEEVYGRGNFRGYWWSPDSARIAYLQLDESGVPDFVVVDHVPYHLALEVGPYPKPGDPNPRVRLGVVDAVGGRPRWVDTRRYGAVDHLIVRVSWSPEGEHLLYQVQDREQHWLELNQADPATGRSRTLLRETSAAWVDVLGEPRWLADGSFLWLSERDGWRHIYRYAADGTFLGRITSGPWEVRQLHGVDETRGWIYFSATEHSPIELHAYRVRLDGSGLERLTDRPGTHRANFSPTLSHFIDSWSDVRTPWQVRLHDATGALVRVIDDNPVPALGNYRLGEVEFLRVPTRDGFVMEAMIIRPPGFDPARRYPVLVHTYGGPHAPQVRNRWGGRRYLWHQLLAQRGYIVWICDNRTASGKGAVSTWPLHRRFGELELRDLEDGVAWLRQQPYVDGSRVGIWGWSYGGFLVTYALTHSSSFALGVAGAPVTDWRAYDTIYTERYLDMPQNNPDGYRRSSPVHAAGNLRGKLLLIHGTMDDNVHLQHTILLAEALQRAGKHFQLMLYPGSRHRIADPGRVKHLYALMTEFILENLGGSRAR